MIERVRAHLSYANVMATLAVFIALGGASYAAFSLPRDSVGSRELKNASVGTKELKRTSVGTGELKLESVTSGQLQEGSVRHDRLREHSVGAENLRQNSVGPASLQGNAVNTDQLAPGAVTSDRVRDFTLQYSDIDPGAVAPRMFAHVSSSGVLGERSPSVVSAGRISKGQYYVDFDRDLRGCVAVSSVGFGFGPGVIGAGGTSQPRMNLDNDASKVGITVYRKGYTFNDIEDNDVSVIVNC
jgi:hypothetical protein